jgi:hypothetical protein
LAILTAIVFGVSAVFPLVAAFVKDREAWPAWWGAVDVALALVLAALAFFVIGLAQSRVTKDAECATYRAYRLMIHGILVVLVLFILAGDRIVWGNCLTGIAWRVWLLLYGLPSWFTLMRERSDPGAGRN